MLRNAILIYLFVVNTFNYITAASEAVSKTAFILRLPVGTTFNLQYELKEFKRRVEEVRQVYSQAWLVVAASLGSKIEKVRFQDPRWVFWNLQILEEDGIHEQGRLGIIGDALAGKNWQLIAKELENSFDFITDDWAFEYPTTDLYDILHSMHTMLRVGGQSMMKMQNFHHILSLEERVLEWVDKNLSLHYTPSSTVPFRHGGGGSNICQIFASYSPETRRAIPTNSLCDLYLREIDPRYKEKEDTSLLCLNQDCEMKTQSFLCRLAGKSPAVPNCGSEGMQLLIDEVKLLVAQSVKGWQPPVARDFTEEDAELYAGSIVFQKKFS